MCASCGWDFLLKKIGEKERLLNYLGGLTKKKGRWIEEVNLKLRLSKLQFPIERELAKFLEESNGTTSTDIRLAEALAKYPELLECKTKSNAKARLQSIQVDKTQIPVAVIEAEEKLQEYLNIHWNETEFGKDWELKRGSSPLVTQGRYNTGDVGEIDLLAKHRRQPKWLVVELKKDSSGDKTLGQILRYMGWVKEHLAVENDQVEGIILARGIDKNLVYAIKCVPAVGLRLYRFGEEGKVFFMTPQAAELFDLLSLPKDQLAQRLTFEQLEQLRLKLEQASSSLQTSE
jgi:hypothetical protein